MLFFANVVFITQTTLSSSIQTTNSQTTMASNATSPYTMDMNMSLYIPRVDTRSLPRGNRHAAEYETNAADFIGKQFKYQKIGEVDRVDLLRERRHLKASTTTSHSSTSPSGTTRLRHT